MSSKMKYLWIENSTRERLGKQLAEDISDKLNQIIKTKGQAIIAFSGGSTPTPLFESLVNCDVDWTKVVITLVDERCVDDHHVLSNARFIKNKLISKLPKEATFIPIYYPGFDDFSEITFNTITRYCEATESDIDSPARFDVVVLGMGHDAHTASFFPDADNIDALIDPQTEEYLLSCESVSTQVSRITWSLRMLLNTEMLVLHITGKNKKQTFKLAEKNGEVSKLPIRSVIFQDKCRLNVYYAD